MFFFCAAFKIIYIVRLLELKFKSRSKALQEHEIKRMESKLQIEISKL
jgi:hypothetical protein